MGFYRESDSFFAMPGETSFFSFRGEEIVMKRYHMKPFATSPDIDITVPGSKSITNRALLLAALAEGKSVLKGVLFSDDSRVFMRALQTLGYEVVVEEEKAQVTLRGMGTKIPKDNVEVYVGSAGTAARFLTAMLALSGGRYDVTSSEQMRSRPMRPLLRALESLGVKFEYKNTPYCFPFTILEREKKACERVYLNIDESSQFLSALLLNGVFCQQGFTVELTGQRDAKAYVKISMKMMDEFGVQMEQCGENEYKILPKQHYLAREYQIEPDVSAACYFYGMAAINGGKARVRHVHFDSTQGDIQFIHALEKMGCRAEDTEEGIVVYGPEEALNGITINMSDFSDQTMTLACVAVFAKGTTRIFGVGHIRRQESDRIRAIVTELKRVGIECEEKDEEIVIHPDRLSVSPEHPVEIETYDDHRMAMAFSLLGTRVEGIVINDPLCCRKTFENYFVELTKLNLELK